MRKILIYALIIINVWSLIQKDDTNNIDNIKVEIKGAVINPGVYTLNKDSTISELVKKASGLESNADISVTNMAKRLEDEDVVIIYSKDEINEMKKGNTSVKYVDKECMCPMINNVSLFDEAVTNLDGIIIDTGKVSLNSATKEELMTLPGIGESKANLIIEYRENNNGFKTTEEIMNVKGIGKSMYEKIKGYIIL